MTTHIQFPIQGKFDLCMRIRLCGQDGELTSVEKEISNMEIPRDLEMMAMDCETTVDGLSFSSVVIRLRAHSARAAALLSSKVMEPGGLVTWLESLLTDEQKYTVALAGLHTVTVEIRIVSHAEVSDDECQCLLLQDDIRGASLTTFRENVRDVDAILFQMYALSCFSYLQRKEMLRLSNIRDNEEKISEFRVFLLTLTGKELCVLESALRRTNHSELLERLTEAARKDGEIRAKRNHIEIKRCTSVLSADTIEKALPLMTCGPIDDLDTFVQRLVTWCPDDNYIDRINEIKAMANNTDKTRQTLLLLKQMPQSCICQFEHFLKETGQGNILCCLKEHNDLLALGEIGKREIGESLTFLCTQIDPRLFYNIIPESALKIVTSSVRRQERCRALFRYILDSENSQDLVRRFVTQLLNLKLYHIINVLFSVKQARNFEQARVYDDILKHKLLENKVLIADEVDVNMLKATFVDRKILTTEQASAIANRGSRRESVVALLEKVLNQGYHAAECFVSALKISGYTYVAGCIENTADPALSCSCISPSMDQTQTYLSETFLAEITITGSEYSIKHPSIWSKDIKTPRVGNKDTETPTAGKKDNETPTAGNKDIETPRVGNKDNETPRVGKKDIENPRVGNKDIETPRVGNIDSETPKSGNKDSVIQSVENKDIEPPKCWNKDSGTRWIHSRGRPKPGRNGSGTALFWDKFTEDAKRSSDIPKLRLTETFVTDRKAKSYPLTNSKPLTETYKQPGHSQLLKRTKDRQKLKEYYTKSDNGEHQAELWGSKRTIIKRNTRTERERSAIVPFHDYHALCFSHNTTVP